MITWSLMWTKITRKSFIKVLYKKDIDIILKQIQNSLHGFIDDPKNDTLLKQYNPMISLSLINMAIVSTGSAQSNNTVVENNNLLTDDKENVNSDNIINFTKKDT